MMAPAAIDGSRVPSASASVSTATAWNARNATAINGCGGTWPLTSATTAIASRPDSDRIGGDDDRQARASARRRSSARRSGRASIAWTVPVSTSEAIAGAAEERRRHRQHEAEHERDEDQDLAHADPDLEPRRRPPRGPATRGARSPTRRARTLTTDRPRSTQRIRRRAISRSVRPAIDEHLAQRSSAGLRGGRPDEVEEQVLERAAAGVDGVDRVRRRRRPRRRASGTRSRVQRRGRRASPRRRARPGRTHRAGRSSPGRSVTRSRTAVSPRRSSSEPAATTRPWFTIATRSHSRSTSPRRCELRRTARPARLGVADDRADVVAADGVERGRRLVEDHERRVAEERGGEAEALLHALREAGRPVACAAREAHEREHPLDLGGAARRGRGRRGSRGARAPRGPSATPGSGTARAGSRCGAGASRSPSGAPRTVPAAGRRAGEAEQQLDRGRLAGAVRTEEPEHLARLDADVERLERDGRAVGLAQRRGSRWRGWSRGDCRADRRDRARAVTA